MTLQAPEPLPAVARTGLTLVATSFDSTEGPLMMELVSESVAATDTVVLVTADRPPAESIAAHEQQFTGTDSPELAIVDITADQQYSDTYHDVTVVGVPGFGDLTRTLIGIADVATEARRHTDAVHVLIPDLGPFLRSSEAHVTRMLRSLLAEAAIDGSVVGGVRYTAHDTATVAALQTVATKVVLAERTADQTIQARVCSSVTGRRGGPTT